MAKRKSQLLEILYAGSLAAKIQRSSARMSERGLATELRYPFLAIVGQTEMKMALILALINRTIGGVLLIGARGTAKTTAVRGLLDLMPVVERSTCEYGCEPDDVYAHGMDGLCSDCATKIGMGDPITESQPMRLVELPLNTRLEDVVGGINERVALEQKRILVDRGVLSYADNNVMYIDEVNLLDDTIIDAILDAAAQGQFTVRRGPMTSTYRSRLTLVGSMNPEEGNLRPQIQDRFGLRVLVRGVKTPAERLEIYRRATSYQHRPYLFVQDWYGETDASAAEISEARKRLPKVTLSPEVERVGLSWIESLEIESHRAEMTLFEAGRAYAAADDRVQVTLDDLRAIAPLALRQRQAKFMTDFFAKQDQEEVKIKTVIGGKAIPEK
ncbi:ATP-binding protein [Anaerolineales bacterium HSG6]|nr:ATP-binding protein [Anaerolineales bacterium HSG6]